MANQTITLPETKNQGCRFINLANNSIKTTVNTAIGPVEIGKQKSVTFDVGFALKPVIIKFPKKYKRLSRKKQQKIQKQFAKRLNTHKYFHGWRVKPESINLYDLSFTLDDLAEKDKRYLIKFKRGY